jgi:hypothetical protein
MVIVEPSILGRKFSGTRTYLADNDEYEEGEIDAPAMMATRRASLCSGREYWFIVREVKQVGLLPLVAFDPCVASVPPVYRPMIR